MQLFTNNADSSLNGAIASNTLVLTLKTGEGSKFPLPNNGEYFLVTLYQKLGSGETNHEIVKCTSRVGDSLTVERAQEGTTAKAFNDGDPVELRLTAESVSGLAKVREEFEPITTNEIAKVFGKYRFVASCDLTLPSNPTNGDWVSTVNHSNTLTCRVLGNGQNINGLAEALTIDVLWVPIKFVFVAGYGWMIV